MSLLLLLFHKFSLHFLVYIPWLFVFLVFNQSTKYFFNVYYKSKLFLMTLVMSSLKSKSNPK